MEKFIKEKKAKILRATTSRSSSTEYYSEIDDRMEEVEVHSSSTFHAIWATDLPKKEKAQKPVKMFKFEAKTKKKPEAPDTIF